MQNRRQVRNFFPETTFQFRFLCFLGLASVLHLMITGLVIFYFLRQNYLLMVEYAGLDEATYASLFAEFRLLVILIISTFIVHLVCMMTLGTSFSHRVGGVIYAVKRTIKDINDGKPSRLKLRKSDEFQELSDSFNEMVAYLRAEQQKVI